MDRKRAVPEGPTEGTQRPPASDKIQFGADRLTFAIGLNPTRNVLEVRAEGELNSKNARHIARKISEFASKHRCSRVFFDYSQTHLTDSILSIYENPPYMEREGLTRAMRLAVRYERDEQKHRFWETVFRNRGYMARVFNNEDDALQWLMDATRY